MKNYYSLLMLMMLAFGLSAQTTYNVTFQVDMNDYTGAFTTPEVNGIFNGWCGNCAPMADANGDNVWDLTIALPAGQTEYKFSHDNWSGQENLLSGTPCTVTNSGFTNRSLNVTGDTVLPVVCWESCQACAGSPTQGTITFQVDMSNYTGTYTDVNLNGTFNNWCGGCAIMTDPDGDMIYELAVTLPLDTIEYKFTVDGWTDDETLTPGDPCTATDGAFTNRQYIVTGDATLPAVCWESCAPCGGSPTTADVTFQVDMSDYAGTYTDVNLNGTFNNWCGGCAIMTDPDGDMIYELMVTLNDGDTIEYKFTVDGWTDDETLDPNDPCTVTDGTFTNRGYVVAGDATLPAVCWESCDPCNTVGIDEGELQEMSVQPNPTQGELSLQLPKLRSGAATWNCYDMRGAMLMNGQANIVNGQADLDVSGLPYGVYLIRLEADGTHFYARFVKE